MILVGTGGSERIALTLTGKRTIERFAPIAETDVESLFSLVTAEDGEGWTMGRNAVIDSGDWAYGRRRHDLGVVDDAPGKVEPIGPAGSGQVIETFAAGEVR